MPHTLEFRLVPWFYQGEARATAVVPVIDGVSLVDLASEFERSHNYDQPGKYCGYNAEYVHNAFNYHRDDLGHYQGRNVELLSCNGCFEDGCWPLEASIAMEPDTVIWQDFRQPHRIKRNYKGLGPYEFDRRQYQAAMASLRKRLAAA